MRLPAAYTGLLATRCATVLFTVPCVISQLLLRGALDKYDLSALRWIFFGGDNHSPEHIRQLMQALPYTRFSHMYGPAEPNGCTYRHLHQPPSDPKHPVPIGYDCEGMQVELRNEHGTPPADDQPGEVWVHGATLMQGYWNRPELSERTMIDLPNAGKPSITQR